MRRLAGRQKDLQVVLPPETAQAWPCPPPVKVTYPVLPPFVPKMQVLLMPKRPVLGGAISGLGLRGRAEQEAGTDRGGDSGGRADSGEHSSGHLDASFLCSVMCTEMSLLIVWSSGI